jgi:hypothetical protein
MKSRKFKDKISNSEYYKYQNIAPDGFILLPEELIEELKDFDVWKTFKHDENFLESRSIDIVKGWYKDI